MYSMCHSMSQPWQSSVNLRQTNLKLVPAEDGGHELLNSRDAQGAMDGTNIELHWTKIEALKGQWSIFDPTGRIPLFFAERSGKVGLAYHLRRIGGWAEHEHRKHSFRLHQKRSYWANLGSLGLKVEPSTVRLSDLTSIAHIVTQFKMFGLFLLCSRRARGIVAELVASNDSLTEALLTCWSGASLRKRDRERETCDWSFNEVYK